MQCYTQLLPPTAVTHSIALPFLGPVSDNLLVVKTTLLQVFEIARSNQSKTPRLSLVGEYALAGVVTSLKHVKVSSSKNGGDAALLAFKDAKLSLIEWDADNHRISTISIHYYEGDHITSQPFGPSLSDSSSILTIDPSSRCAALKFGARHVAILPFRQSGDDLGADVEGDFDQAMDGAPPSTTVQKANGPDEEEQQMPYKSSFVLPLTALDASLLHPVDLALLYEYREPTFGILSSAVQPTMALLDERKDCITYSVFTLDLEQRASTNLISVSDLPSDLWKVVPLPVPIGGALLIGQNEIVHVDQSGKTNAVAVNEFSTRISSYGMSDQSDLSLELEDCQIEPLDPKTGDLLIILNDGSLAILNFEIAGRNVGALRVSRVARDRGGLVVASAPSTVASLGHGTMFVGSDYGDSSLLSWNKDSVTLSRKRSHAQMLEAQEEHQEDPDEMEDDEDDDDDLYAPSKEPSKAASSTPSTMGNSGPSSYKFVRCDTLRSVAPMDTICLGKPQTGSNPNRLEIMTGTGRDRGSKLTAIGKGVKLESDLPTQLSGVQNAWALRLNYQGQSSCPDEQQHNCLFAFDGETTKIYNIEPALLEEGEEQSKEPSASQFNEREGTEFEHEGETLAVSTVFKDRRVVQCRRNEIRTYDADLGLAAIIPMVDEDTDAELNIVATSFSDPYVLVLRDDSSVQILHVDQRGDIEPLELEGTIKERKWLSGCLYAGSITAGVTCAFILAGDGALHILSLPDLASQYVATSLPHLPAVIYGEGSKRRAGVREAITEILVADLGEEDVLRTYLVARTSMDDLVLYEPFSARGDGAESGKAFDDLRFRKVPNESVPKYDEALNDSGHSQPAPIKTLRLGRHAALYVPGSAPTIVLKDATSLPKMIGLQASRVRNLCSLNTADCAHGFLLIDNDNNLRQCQPPADAWYGTGWSVQSSRLGDPPEEVRQTAYHDERNAYIVATCRDVPFYFPEEEGKHIEDEDISLRPRVPQYTLHLMLAANREVISTFEMPYLETITSMKVMSLEVSEHSRQQKQILVVASAIQQGEDRPTRGVITVFDLIDVVPIIGRPETAFKLKVVAREDIRGAITAIEGFPGGFVGTVQGQKIMIRGLKDDGSCLPVAFLDALCNMTTLKTLGSSGMWLAGDSWKGLWFGGFVQDPYRLSVLGKSRTKLEVVTAEFLPFSEQLFVLLVDANTDLHVLQYDPENPKSLSGTRLLHRGSFHLGHFPSSMTLLPSRLAPFSEQSFANGHSEDDESPADAPSLFHVLVTSTTGSMGLVTPVDETTYRRLTALQTHLTSILEHPAGLNPRAFRTAESDGTGMRGGIIDGSLVQRISELGASRKAEVLGRAGGDVWGLRSDLEIIGGGGLGYL